MNARPSAEQEAQMALSLARALAEATSAAAGRETSLVSITCDLIARPEANAGLSAHAEITRATRSLVFASADLRDASGARLMTASAVYRVLGLAPTTTA